MAASSSASEAILSNLKPIFMTPDHPPSLLLNLPSAHLRARDAGLPQTVVGAAGKDVNRCRARHADRARVTRPVAAEPMPGPPLPVEADLVQGVVRTDDEHVQAARAAARHIRA